MEPGDIAEVVFDRVMDFCTKIHDQTLECLADHAPEQLSVFMDSYLEDEDNDINEAIENSDHTFWEAIEKEYEKLWTERLSIDISDSLGDILSLIAENIMQNDELNDASKVRYLKAYDEVLDKFGEAIKRALQDSEPLSPEVLQDWYMKIGDAVSVNTSDYSNEVSYFVDFYTMLDDNEQLKVLSNLLDDVSNVLYDIEQKYMRDFGALTNNS
jgi:hypothetical protein